MDNKNDFSRSHDIAEVAGLTGMSFGEEGVDRYIIVYKKNYVPSEDEIEARRNGDEWNEEKAKEYAQRVSLKNCLFVFLINLDLFKF